VSNVRPYVGARPTSTFSSFGRTVRVIPEIAPPVHHPDGLPHLDRIIEDLLLQDGVVDPPTGDALVSA
jgi:hypothetical protein